MKALPTDATHLVVSVGGNDALLRGGILSEAASTVGEALEVMHEVWAGFRNSYHAMLRVVGGLQKPTAVCIVYNTIPGLRPAEHAALAGFNEVILREAFGRAAGD